MKKGGEFLFEDVIMIVLTLMVFTILIFFIVRSGSGAVALEEVYAKNIALLIDAGKPVMEMTLNMEDAFKLAEKNEIDREQIVQIEGNEVVLKLSQTGDYRYSFFNNYDISVYPDVYPSNDYIIKINGYK